jgi:hypothetical protein
LPICDALTHSTAVMTTSLRQAARFDALFHDLDDEQSLPAVSS